MNQTIGAVTLVVRDYDEAIAYYTSVLGFRLVEDTHLGGGKRWVLVAPPGNGGTGLLLARAATPEQRAAVGRQTGGRVFLFLHTDDFARDHVAMSARGVRFVETPRHEPYGTVAVFEDVYGNRWDLIEPHNGERNAATRNADVLACEARLTDAERAGDRAALEALVASEFIGIDPHGQPVDRNRFIASLCDRGLRFSSLSIAGLQLVEAGGAWVVVGESQFEGEMGGRQFSGRARFLDGWRQTSRGFQLCFSSVTPQESPAA